MDIGIVCDNCDTLNETSADACKACGAALQEVESSRSDAPPADAEPEAFACPACGMELPASFRFCGNCGHKLDPPQDEAPAGAGTLFFGAMQTPNRAKLILIKGEGMDGIAYHLNATEHIAGREEGGILFPEDPMLSPRHACFFYEENALMVRDEESANGVFVRLIDPLPLEEGTRFLVGEQLLQFETCEGEEAAPRTDDDGTYFYSSPRRPSQFKLIQILQGGDVGMIYRAPTAVVTLGREGNDINFPDDPYISGRHARVAAGPNGFELVDLSSKNGTFYRVARPTKLEHGDYLFIGQQLLRVEIT